MDLIDKKAINFYCSYNGDCTGNEEKCKTCENYVCTYQDIYEKESMEEWLKEHDKEIKFKTLDDFAKILKEISYPMNENANAIWLDDALFKVQQMKKIVVK